MARQAERSAATRGRLVEAAGALFARRGYDATSTDAVLERAGVSKGALYHHFASKQELFAAVFESVAAAAIERTLRGQRPAASELEGLIAGCMRWLREARRPEVAAILLDQGPRVLGFRGARDLEARSSLGIMRRGLERAVRAGEIEVPSVTAAARLLNAVLAEAALLGLESGQQPSRTAIEATVRRLVLGLAA